MARDRTSIPAAGLMLRLSEGTSMTFIDDAPAIFSEGRHALFEVNRIAGYIGCRLEDGISFGDLADEIINRGFCDASAETMLRRVLAEWSHSGLVQAASKPPCSRPSAEQMVAVGGVHLHLRYHDAHLAAQVAPGFVHLETDRSHNAIRYDLWTTDGLILLSRNGGPASVLQPTQATPVLKARIAEDVMADPAWPLALHAGCVHRNGRAMLLAGRPGAGKTTLTSWLIDAGFAYGGDDITVMNVTGRVQGLPFLPSIKPGAWRLIASRCSDLSRLSVHVRPDGKRVRYPTPRDLADQFPVEVGWILKLRRGSGSAARLVPLSPTAAIKHLLSEAASPSGDVTRGTFDTVVRMVEAAHSFELHYSDLDDAATLLRGLCDHGRA